MEKLDEETLSRKKTRQKQIRDTFRSNQRSARHPELPASREPPRGNQRLDSRDPGDESH